MNMNMNMNITVEQFLKLNDIDSLRGVIEDEDFTIRVISILLNISEDDVLYLSEDQIIEALKYDLNHKNKVEEVIVDNNKVIFKHDMYKMINAQYFTIKQYQIDISEPNKLFLLTISELIDSESESDNKIDIIKKLNIADVLYLYDEFIKFDEFILNNYKIIFEEDYDDEYRNKGYKIPKNFNIIGMLDRLSSGSIINDEAVLKQNVISTMNRLAYWAHRDKRINSINKIISNKNGK